MNELQLTGFHHLTAVSADIRENKRFFTEDLGLRLVKRSVNQDDTSAYHLFYADAVGTPGTDVTFFDWEVPREQRGNHTVTRTGLRVADGEALRYWQRRFEARGIEAEPISERDGRALIDFEDHEGQRMALVVDGGSGDAPTPWAGSDVPAEYQIRGLGPITMTVPSLSATDMLLRRVMNMVHLREYAHASESSYTVHVYGMGAADGPYSELHVAVRPTLRPARPGAGGVHHVAFRIPDDAYEAWAERLNLLGVRNSGKVNRYYFRSLYFREPNGVLFELATDGPGFAVDEPIDNLGDRLALPPFLESRREKIEAGLRPID